MNKYDELKSKKSNKKLFLIAYILLLAIANIFNFNIISLLVLFFISYFVFLAFSFKSLKNIKNVILSAEVIFETIFFIYAVPAAIMFVLDGYQPRISYFLIDNNSILETLKLYFNINCIFIILMILMGGVHTLNFYNREKDLKSENKIKFDIFDLIAVVLVVYFYYLHFRNGLSIFGAYFHDLRELIQSSIHNFNSYIYLYMIPYSCVNIYKMLYNDKVQTKIGKYKKIFVPIILVLFWGISLLTDRRNFVVLLFMLVLMYIYKLRKVAFKVIAVFTICIVVLLSVSFFRSGTSNKSINNVLFLSMGEFVLTNYVSNYYINNCDDLKYGRTYILDPFISFIPRSIYPGKPKMLSQQFQEDAKTNVAYAFNPVAEGLINFGKIGATIAVPLVMLFLVKLAYCLSKRHLLFFIIVCAEAINFFRGIFSVSIFSIVAMSVFTLLMLKIDVLAKYRIKKRNNVYYENNPEVSVIMATYNTEKEYLTKAIDSILNQTLKNFEFIIICDGSSTDLDVIKMYNDSRIKIIEHKENKGLPYSLNEGIKVAKGKYIARMDSDDIAIKNRLEKQVIYLENHPNIDICSMFCKKIGKENNIDVLPYTTNDLLKIHLLFCNALVHPLIMLRKSFIIKNDLLYNEEILCSQDYELWNRCTKKGKVSIIGKIGLYYRIHDNQISTGKKEKQLNFYKQILINNFTSFRDFDVEINLDKILVLFDGSRKINMTQFIELSNFIDEVIEKNVEYSNEDLKTVLYLKLFNIGLKSKLILSNLLVILKMETLREKVFRFSNFELNLKKNIYKIKCKLCSRG